MTTQLRSKFLTSCAATALVAAVALASAGCVHDSDAPADGGMDMTPPPEPDPQALADTIDLVASWATEDADGNTISGWWIRDDVNESGNQEHLGHSHSQGAFPTPVVSYDANGPQFNVGLFQLSEVAPLSTDPWAQAHRYISTYEIGDDPEGGDDVKRGDNRP